MAAPPPTISKKIPARVGVWTQAKQKAEARRVQLEELGRNDFAKYRNDPIAFIMRELGERITPDVEELCESFLNTPTTVARSANSTGKTHAAARLAVWFYLVWNDAKVYTFAAPPETNLRRLLWGEIGGIVVRYPRLFQGMSVSLPGLHIERHPESFLTGVTIPVALDPKSVEGRFSGKHAPHMAFFGDEADQVPGAVFKGIESCCTGGHHRRLFMFNPRQKGGEVYLMEKEKRARVVHLSAFNHPNVVTGKDVHPGAVDRETTCRRVNKWCVPLQGGVRPDAECFQLPSFLEGYVAHREDGTPYPPLKGGWYRIVNSLFSYMVLGVYPALGEMQLISEADIERMFDRWDDHVSKYGVLPPKGVDPISGQDVAEYGQDESVNALRYDWWVAPFEAWSKEDPDETAKRASQICLNAGALYCNVDATGVGAGVPPAMIKHYDFQNAYRTMVGTSAPDDPDAGVDDAQCELIRDLMLWRLAYWVQHEKRAAVPRCEMLKEEMLQLQYTFNIRRKVKITSTDDIKEKIGRSPDRLMALALTFAPEGDSVSKAESQNYLKQTGNAPPPGFKPGYKAGYNGTHHS